MAVPDLALDAKEGAARAPVGPSVLLVASVNGREVIGTVALGGDVPHTFFTAAHCHGHRLRSIAEFWDGDVAGSAEGVLSIVQTDKSSYEIQHDFIELSRVDAGAKLYFEDDPEMRIVIAGPSCRAVIRPFAPHAS